MINHFTGTLRRCVARISSRSRRGTCRRLGLRFHQGRRRWQVSHTPLSHTSHTLVTHLTYVCGIRAASIILRGANDFLIDEVERCIHDALCVVSRTLESDAVCPGGGAVETALSVYLEDFARTMVSRWWTQIYTVIVCVTCACVSV